MRIIKITLILVLFELFSCLVKAQTEHLLEDELEIPSFWSNWYVQTGLDMSLQNPYGCNFSKVFPNGKSFGLDIAAGKWFTPELSLRGKFNWENGVGLFRNNHANWLAPFHQGGKNMDQGGYITVVGDIQFDINNLFIGYNVKRIWNIQIYPRAGIAYNFGSAKGAILLGAGIGNTFRINDNMKIYFDIDYQMVGSGFVGSGVKNTGTGSNSNGFFDMNVGVQFNIGRHGFKRVK